ncbi:MAG: trigger factor [Ruminococcaceae bacterium]|nr:trigger factor [Oscillospiraceae bacterium]
MKLVKAEKIEASKYELQISVDTATFEAAVNKAFQKEGKKMSIPGFRKGKAPRSIIEKMYGKGVFYETAINDLIPDAYSKALEESKINPVAQPEFDIVSLDDNGLVLSAKVFVKPDVEIADYLGLTVSRTVAPVTDEEVDREINTVRERNSRETEVLGRGAEMGDTATIDYEGFCDGKAFDGGKGEDYALKLGSNTFIPGFEEQIVGKKVDEAFDVNVTFPTEYHAKELAGKEAVFKCKLHALTRTELPELDDEFAKDVSEFDTFAEYKADMKAKIEKRHTDSANAAADEKLVDALIEKLNADIPAPMFDTEAENFLRDYDMRLRQSGLDLNTYIKYTGMTLDGLRDQFRPQAERQVKARLALEKIAELEKLEATEEDINAEYQRIADAYNMPVDQVKQSIPTDAITDDMRVKKAMDLVREKAVITDEAPAAEKKPAKKPATKKAATDGEAKPAAKKTTTKSTTAKSTGTKTTTAKKTTTKKAETDKAE